MNNSIRILTVMAGLLWTGIAAADGHAKSWILDEDSSKIVFGSVKKDNVGEVHTFDGLSGTVSVSGAVDI